MKTESNVRFNSKQKKATARKFTVNSVFMNFENFDHFGTKLNWSESDREIPNSGSPAHSF